MATILLIDDDSENRDILKTRLERAAYQVIEAQNGEEGLALSVSSKPDLIILDVMMPKMDGWQVCRLLKSNSSTAQIPVVMLTACSKQVEELRGYESGANDFMMKPWNHDRLLEIIRKWIPGAAEHSAPLAKPESPKAEASPIPETQKPEVSKPEAPKPETSKPEEPKPRTGGIWA
jgi:DNA-binding response OmpR family regulator